MTPDQSASYRPIIYSLAWDILLNTTIPVACYYLSKTFISPSELTALFIATAFPTLKSAYDLVRHRGINPVAVMVLLGIVTSIIALLIGGDPRILLIRESLFTGGFGVGCLASHLFPRPMMFYFGRYFFAGNDPEKRAVFDSRWLESEHSSRTPAHHDGVGPRLYRRVRSPSDPGLYAVRCSCPGGYTILVRVGNHCDRRVDVSVCI